MAYVKYRKKEDIMYFGKSSGACGINEINSKGRICYKGSYSVMYEIMNVSNEADVFSLLRFYDIRFKILADCIENKKYLILCADYDNRQQADNDMKVLCDDIEKNMNQMNCGLCQVGLNERMRIIHKMSMGGMYINTDNYTKYGDWVKDIGLLSCKEDTESIIWRSNNNITITKQVISLVRVNDIARKIKNIIKMNVEYLFFDFADISDNTAGQFIKSNYIGIEELQLEIEAKNKVLNKALFDERSENNNSFVLAGLYAVIGNRMENFEDTNKDDWNYCRNLQKKMYNSIIPNGSEELAQQRICYCGQVKDDFNLFMKGGEI